MAYSLMFYDVEVHVCIKHMCVCVCVCVLTVHFNVFATGRHIFSLLCVCVYLELQMFLTCMIQIP